MSSSSAQHVGHICGCPPQHLDENCRRLSRPSRIMKRAMARLPRMKWGLRLILSVISLSLWPLLPPSNSHLPSPPSYKGERNMPTAEGCHHHHCHQYHHSEVTIGERSMPRVIAAWNRTSRLEVESSTWEGRRG